MGKGFRLSKRAQSNLAKIWDDVARENLPAADALYFRIFDKIEAAAVHPGIVVTAIVHTRRLPANWS